MLHCLLQALHAACSASNCRRSKNNIHCLSLTRSADWIAARVAGGDLVLALAMARSLLLCLQDEVPAAGIGSLSNVDESNGHGPEVAPVEEDAADSRRCSEG